MSAGRPMGGIVRFFLGCFADNLILINDPLSARAGRIFLDSIDAVLRKTGSPTCNRVAADPKRSRDFAILLAFGRLQDESWPGQPIAGRPSGLARRLTTWTFARRLR